MRLRALSAAGGVNSVTASGCSSTGPELVRGAADPRGIADQHDVDIGAVREGLAITCRASAASTRSSAAAKLIDVAVRQTVQIQLRERRGPVGRGLEARADTGPRM